ncbi:protein kinase [Streptomyces sp. ADI93-02]|uniref:protein kinase domain-containing protein n=1 Tax=Streptomyces sp. ADI93-02 TaxID=1522757 RepID=UPI000F54E0D6|nr:protein kinase [Streptomyces sp. ADI93-02]RPK33292.1 Serine/threonine-protein kinase PknB [Streptomyces sp. ADI93-02]
MHALSMIGRYRVQKLLGVGAFGVVWLAHDDRLDAPVAVKVMADNWARRLDLCERFLGEARLLRKAESPRVVHIYDIGELEDERPYFVMQYADGGSLEDRLADGPLPLEEALRLAAEAARAVAVLHGAGILHRDVKPSNMLLTSSPDGRPDRLLVADLGLAKSLAHSSGLSLVAGSAGYMAPELADPCGGVDERADVYGLGALAHHLVTGAVPGPPGMGTAPSRIREGVPDRVDRVVLRAMDPDREERWPTALVFAEELEAAARNEHELPVHRTGPARSGVPSVFLRPPGSPASAQDPRRRRRRLALGVGAVVITGALTGWITYGRPEGPPVPAAHAEVDGDRGNGVSQSAAADSAARTRGVSAGPTSLSASKPGGTPRPSTTREHSNGRQGATADVPGGHPTTGDGLSAAPPRPEPSSSASWATLCVQPNTSLPAGQTWSTNRTRMVMQTNGDLVIYDEDYRRRWSSGTAGSGYRAFFQGDGNLVVFDRAGEPQWHSGSYSHEGAVLCLGADGSVNILHNDQVLWSANTAH